MQSSDLNRALPGEHCLHAVTYRVFILKGWIQQVPPAVDPPGSSQSTYLIQAKSFSV